MTELYLKVANDIDEDVLLCYVYSKTGACYGLKYSQDNGKQMSVVVLNSRQTDIESEQDGEEACILYKDDLIHIYPATDKPGEICISTIHDGVESKDPTLFILKSKDGASNTALDTDPFSFAGIKAENFSESVNAVIEIGQAEYESRLQATEGYGSGEESSSADEMTSEEEVVQQTNEDRNDSAADSDAATSSLAVSESSVSDTRVNPTQNNVVPFVIVGAVLAAVVAVILVLMKNGTLNDIIAKFKGNKRKKNRTKKQNTQGSGDYYVRCSVTNQSSIRNRSELLAHSLYKYENDVQDVDIKLTTYCDHAYFRNQSASELMYRRTYPSAELPKTAFIIAMTKEWHVVVARHNSKSSITLDVLCENYVSRESDGINWLFEFLSTNIEKKFTFHAGDRQKPAESFYRFLNILMSYHKNDEYANDSLISSARNSYKDNKEKWEEVFKERLPDNTISALIIMAELYFVKDLTKRTNYASKWVDLIGLLRNIRDEVESRIVKMNAAVNHQPLPVNTRAEKETGSEKSVADPMEQALKEAEKGFSELRTSPPPASSPTPEPPPPPASSPTPEPPPPPVSSPPPVSPPPSQVPVPESGIEMYANVDKYFSENYKPEFCRPATDVTAYHITTPYKLNILNTQSRPAIPEFILIGSNLYPNPYRFKKGVLKQDDITRIMLDAIFDIDRISTGQIKQITPAKVNRSTMTVEEKGEIRFLN